MSDSTFFESSKQASAYVYLIQAESGPVKIGIATDPNRRLSELQTANYELLTLLYRLECNSLTDAQQLETVLHRRYAQQRIRGEWFDSDPRNIIEDIEMAIGIAQIFKRVFVERVDEILINSATRTSDGQARVIEYLNEHPDEADLPSRRLAELIGVGHDTANKGRNAWREQQNDS